MRKSGARIIWVLGIWWVLPETTLLLSAEPVNEIGSERLNQWIVMVMGLVVVAGLGWWIRTLEMRAYLRRLKIVEQQSSLHAERARIAKDMHDELGANLTRIKLLSELIESQADSPERAILYARHISKTARELAQGMDEIVWAVNPDKDRLENLVFYVGAFTEESLNLTPLRYRLHLPDQVPDLALPAEVRHHLFLAMKEALHNVVKHSKATEVIVRLSWTENHVELQVQDNGIGLPVNGALRRRNGLSNMQDRLAQLGGSCILETAPEKGTTVRLTAPISSWTGPSHI